MRTPSTCGILASVLLTVPGAASAQAPPFDAGAAREALTRGVKEIAAPGVPGPLAVFGERAVAVVAGKTGEARAPVVAAAELGKGRLVAFGHTGYFGPEAWTTADTGTLLENALAWVSRGKARGAARIACQDSKLAEALRGRGFTAATALREGLERALAEADVLCFSHPAWSDADVKLVRAFVENGGGALVAGLGWGWLQLNPGKSLDVHPGNRLTAEAGILFADGTLERTGKAGFEVRGEPLVLCNADRALDALQASIAAKTALSDEDLTQVTATLRSALAALPPGDHRIRMAAAALLSHWGNAPFPTESRPLTRKDGLARLQMTLRFDDARNHAPGEAPADPSAAAFPGYPAAGAKPVEHTLDVVARGPRWHGTGLYAAPGEKVVVTLTDEGARAGLGVRIGCHTDELWHLDRWKRAPAVSRHEPLTAASTSMSSLFGGLLYVDVPAGRTGAVSVKIAGAYAAPRFVLGKTTPEAWRAEIRQAPAPWAELETGKIALTVPSSAARALDDPTPLLTFWDAVADAAADFVALPRERPRPERFVADVQISAGYMHSGYPIMLPLGEVGNLIELDKLKKGPWGLFHELGHNHQDGAWTFEGTGEVTNNVIAMYILDTLCAVPPGRGWGGFDGIEKTVKAHIVKGAPFDEWKSDPALALWMYKQLYDGFGWDPFKRVFAEYRALPRGERPRSDAVKRDEWMVRFSRAAGRNLGPFFEAWGVPTSSQARDSIAKLPAWMPSGFPPAAK
jgi:hypothetical protein